MNGRSASAVVVAVLLGCNAGPGDAFRPNPRSVTPVVARTVPLSSDPIGVAWWSGFHEPARLVIRSQADWDAAWAIVQEPISTKTPAPEVDFSTEMVVLAALGDCPSGGYTVALSATSTQSSIQAVVFQRRPGAGCAQLAVITSPVAAIAIPRSDLPVEFMGTVVRPDCE